MKNAHFASERNANKKPTPAILKRRLNMKAILSVAGVAAIPGCSGDGAAGAPSQRCAAERPY